MILATSDKVVMADSLEEALHSLTGTAVTLSNSESQMTPRSEVNVDLKTNVSEGILGTSDSAGKIGDSLERLRDEIDALEDLLKKLVDGEKGE